MNNDTKQSNRTAPLPSWLSFPPAPKPKPSQVSVDLRHLEYDQIFERMIEGIYSGTPLRSLIREDPRLISYESFMRWIKADRTRHARLLEAQEMCTELMAGEIIDIADGINTIDPTSNDSVNRDKLRIDTRRWIMEAHNRKRYGSAKQVQIEGSVSIVEALAQAQMRVIEGEVIDVGDDE